MLFIGKELVNLPGCIRRGHVEIRFDRVHRNETKDDLAKDWPPNVPGDLSENE